MLVNLVNVVSEFANQVDCTSELFLCDINVEIIHVYYLKHNFFFSKNLCVFIFLNLHQFFSVDIFKFSKYKYWEFKGYSLKCYFTLDIYAKLKLFLFTEKVILGKEEHFVCRFKKIAIICIDILQTTIPKHVLYT